MSSSPASSPQGPREEVFLESYFLLISNFTYDKAKELAEKERDSHKASFGSAWALMVHSLSAFAMAEKAYMSLTFLGQKWFARSRDSLRNSYHMLITEFRKVEETVRQLHAEQRQEPPAMEDLLAHLCGQLVQFLTARQKTMDFYEQIIAMGSSRQINHDDLLLVISEIIQSYHKNFHHPLLSPLKSNFSAECDAMQHLLQAQKLMAEWQFLPCLLQLHQVHAKLSSWGAVAAQKESYIEEKQSKKSFVSGSQKTPTRPALYIWLVKYKGLLLSKFSLYFYDVLSKQTTSTDMKNLLAKTSDDFVSKITSFHRKSDAVSILLIFDINGIQHLYRGPGYIHPNSFTETPTGKDSYPAIFSYPSERPDKHYPNILMIINKRTDEGNAHDKVICFYDKSAQSTYFIAAVEPRISLAAIYECKKSEKDSSINSFMQDIAAHLRCTKLYSSLKPGSK